MSMVPHQELAERTIALEETVLTASNNGMSDRGVGKLREVGGRRAHASWRALRSDPPARVEPLKLTFKPGAVAVKTRPRVYAAVKMAWLVGGNLGGARAHVPQLSSGMGECGGCNA